MLKRLNRIDDWSNESSREFRKVGLSVIRVPFRGYRNSMVRFTIWQSRGEGLAFDAKECRQCRCEQRFSRRTLEIIVVIEDNQY